MKSQSKVTVLVLANAITLTSGIVGQLTGSQIANTINGNKATNDALNALVASTIQNRLNVTANFKREA